MAEARGRFLICEHDKAAQQPLLVCKQVACAVVQKRVQSEAFRPLNFVVGSRARLPGQHGTMSLQQANSNLAVARVAIY